MIIGIIIMILIVCYLLNLMRTTGWFGLYIDLDIERQRIYGWHKGNIMKSDSFTFTDSVSEILLRKTRLKEKCLLEIHKIKQLKSQL